MGKSSAEKNVIFLHGILPTGEVPKEFDYKPLLEKLANELNLRVAIPKSTQRCQKNDEKLCWHADNNEELEITYMSVIRSAAKCFPPEGNFGLIGFSNGGYFAGKVAMRCLLPKAKWVLAIGSAGDASMVTTEERDGCPVLTVLIGRKDITRDRAKEFVTQLKGKNVKAQFATFAGGHDVLYEPVFQFLSGQAAQL